MSEPLYGVGGLRFWSAREILVREQATTTLQANIATALCRLNSAWTFHRMEGPILTPRNFINAAYDDSDIFLLEAKIAGDQAALRAETTASSYLYAEHLLKSGEAKSPLCVWQVGKSFRRETNDGARASELRFNEFYQVEFQCIYKNNTKADIRACVEPVVAKTIQQITLSHDVRIIPSDRLPSYSSETRDVEVPFGVTVINPEPSLTNGWTDNGIGAPAFTPKWKEMASISTRHDFPMDDMTVLEIAVGLCRLVSVFSENSKGG